MSYSILVRDLTRETDGAPKLLAYDIHDRSAAEDSRVGDRHFVPGSRFQSSDPRPLVSPRGRGARDLHLAAALTGGARAQVPQKVR